MYWSLREGIESVDLDNFDDFDYESLALMDVFYFCWRDGAEE